VRFLLSRSTAVLCLLVMLVVAIPLHAAVAIVRSDETMIRMAPAIVTGTVIETFARLNEAGDIETVTRILVDETIKGNVPVDRTLDLVQFGGELNHRYEAQSGAPKYEIGERYLVVLDRDGRGEWTTFDLSLGQFHFVTRNGNQVLHRDTRDISGWTESGETFNDADRPVPLFLAYAREMAKPSPSASAVLRPVSNAPLDYDLKTVSTSAVGKWHGAESPMNDSVSASPATGDTKDLSDGESRVIADDPHGDVPGTFNGSGVIATAFFGSTGGTTSFNGETYITLNVQDVVVNDGVSSGTLSSGNFLSALTHEFGHTWGWRHSDQNASNGSCALPLPCSSNAIMRASVVNGLNGTLQSWDLDAANMVYGDHTRQAGTFTGSQYVEVLGGMPARRPSPTSWRISQAAATCNTPQITGQPSGSSITAGNPASLSVTATGTATLSYQWYVGNPPSTTTPVPSGTTASIQVSPASTTTYWVRVTNTCPGSVDSNAATVTVTPGCPTVVVGNPTSTDLGNGSFQLSVSASGGTGLTYQWFQGAFTGSGPQVGTGNPFTVTNITTSTSFWVRVKNDCNNTTDSRNVVTVGPNTCNPPSVLTQPQDQSVLVGGTVQLSVGVLGTSPFSFQWFQGAPPDTSAPIGNGQSITSPAIKATTTFYAKVTNNCGTVNSRVVTVTATQTCTPPAITSISANPLTAAPGTQITIGVAATGSSLTYQWFRGASGDTSNPITGATTSSITDTPTATTSYWVRVSSGCGAAAVNSNAVTVTITAACVPPSIVQPPNSEVIYGQKATITVQSTAGTEPLHYAWFMGGKFDTSHPIGTDSPTVTTPSALTQDTQFFVNVSNACGSVNSETITVKVQLPRRRPSKR
jgi:hypothetical protein